MVFDFKQRKKKETSWKSSSFAIAPVALWPLFLVFPKLGAIVLGIGYGCFAFPRTDWVMLMAAVCYQLGRTAMTDWFGYALAGVAAVLVLWKGVNPLGLIVVGAALGLVRGG
jgi:chromate transport protein ChrA